MCLKRFYKRSSVKLKRCNEKCTIAKGGKPELSYSEIFTVIYKYKFVKNRGVFKYNLYERKSILIFKKR